MIGRVEGLNEAHLCGQVFGRVHVEDDPSMGSRAPHAFPLIIAVPEIPVGHLGVSPSPSFELPC